MATSTLPRQALFMLAAIAGALGAQTPMTTTSPLPTPACGVVITAGIADYDSSGRPDFLGASNVPGPRLQVSSDPASGGSACHLTPVPAPVGSLIGAVAANLNGDAYPDALAMVFSESRILDAFGDGAGGFGIPGTGPYPVAAGSATWSFPMVRDFNHDGRDDLALIRVPTNTLEVRLNLPSGWVQTAALPSPNLAYGSNTGDFDGDGNPDLLWIDSPGIGSPSNLRVAFGSGDGTFTIAPLPLVASSDFHYVDVVGDLDGDGRDDLVIRRYDLQFTPYNFPIVWGSPQGATPPITFIANLYETVRPPTIVDFDLDGQVDMMTAAVPLGGGLQPHDAVLYRGLGSRQFTTSIVLGVHSLGGASNLLVADYDGDGDSDFVYTEASPFGGYAIHRYRNETIRAPGCAGSSGLPPSMTVGVATPGNAAFAIGLAGALPNATAVLAVSTAPAAVSGCGIALDLAQLVLPQGAIGVTTTDAVGAASIALPLPPPPGLSGLGFYAQWGVVDPLGPIAVGPYTLALSEARTIYVR